MATKLTVKRLDLIKSIKAKAKSNKEAYDKLVAASSSSHDLIKAFNETLEAKFKGTTNGYIVAANGSGYYKNNIQTNFNTYILAPLGIQAPTVPPAPQLFERQLAILEMSQDETLQIDDSSDYFSFVNS